MMSNLDRSNLGNANIAGMPEEIGLTGNQFGIATTLLYVWDTHAPTYMPLATHRLNSSLTTLCFLSSFATYVPFEGPVAVLLKMVGPKPLMSICAFCWGSVCLGMCKSSCLTFITGYAR